MVPDALVDPIEFDLELVRCEADGAQHAEATGLAHGDDDVAAVREGEDREFDSQRLADGGAHTCSFGGGGRTETCSSLVLIQAVVALGGRGSRITTARLLHIG